MAGITHGEGTPALIVQGHVDVVPIGDVQTLKVPFRANYQTIAITPKRPDCLIVEVTTGSWTVRSNVQSINRARCTKDGRAI